MNHKPLPHHLPPPSFAPPLLALGLMLLLWGAVTSWIVSVVGLLLTAYAATLWMRDA
jgi:hypothetical protein